ncbi:hypothetical protein LCGC14_2369340 [marine sediment metagenome]|uniref:Uncharacterized protein n=1 Tax=marine sediment metagenome TaxID=412755 RepID=A0A0F9C4D0_9ZZZZ
MSDTTLIGPVSKKLRQRLKIFLAAFNLPTYESGIAYLLSINEQFESMKLE